MKIFSILFSIFFITCSSTDSSYFRNLKTKQVEGKQVAEPASDSYSAVSDFRHKDTTIIYLNTIEKNPINTKLNEAVKDIDNENYKKAYSQLNTIFESIQPENKLYNIVYYYLGECELFLNKIEEAEKRFNRIISSKDNSEAIIERSLIRMGQINCLRKQNEKALFYFQKLKEDFPNSIYSAFAKCS